MCVKLVGNYYSRAYIKDRETIRRFYEELLGCKLTTHDQEERKSFFTILSSLEVRTLEFSIPLKRIH